MQLGFYRSVTFWIFFCCLALFFGNEALTKGDLQMGFTSVQRSLLFDYPSKIENLHRFIFTHQIRSDADIYRLPLIEQKKLRKIQEQEEIFLEKIRKGQVWRLFSPCLLHKDLMHLLCNMSWLLPLGFQIEKRIYKARMLFLLGCMGLFSNIMQYWVSGPFFLGFSGIAVGLIGFIWSRKKIAPWEQYSLSSSSIGFAGCFVLGMLLLDRIFTLPFQVAHTAHIAGGFAGIVLGRIRFFQGEVL
jgi:GlpG protein